jgi:transposase InsO family protein
MKSSALFVERKLAVHLLRKGEKVADVAATLDHSEEWVRKWWRRYRAEGYRGLQDHSHSPKQHGRKLKAEVVTEICLARTELEAKRELGTGLKYIGALAIRTHWKQKGITPLPSKASIERVLSRYKLTRKTNKQAMEEIQYPHLRPQQAQELIQVDIAPHYLTGGDKVACFNAIDVFSRYPTGYAYPQRRAQDACHLLIRVWQEMGVSTYTQVDNEGCFSGGHTHPYVLGQAVRLALVVGTELVFSPFYHPQSNAHVERFHQDYDLHVWQDTYLEDYQAVNSQGQRFYQLYRQRLDHSAIVGQSPADLHGKPLRCLLPSIAQLPHPLPLRTGRVHFMRRVDTQGNIKILNAMWAVPDFNPKKGVWATLELQTTGAFLSIYDGAPDASDQRQLISYPFPITETILPWSANGVFTNTNTTPRTISQHTSNTSEASLTIPTLTSELVQVGQSALHVAFSVTAHLTSRVFGTMH